MLQQSDRSNNLPKQLNMTNDSTVTLPSAVAFPVKIVAVSVFSGMDLFMLGCRKYGWTPAFACERSFHPALLNATNFKDAAGNPLIEFVPVPEEEYRRIQNLTDEEDKELDLKCTVGIIDGTPMRPKSIEEYDGKVIRALLHKKYGDDVLIIQIGGPPCQDFTKLTKKKRVGTTNRNRLVFEYLRFLEGLAPDIALMEEVPDFNANGTYKELYSMFICGLSQLPYVCATMDMNSLHYGSNQSRERKIFNIVSQKLNKLPEFPDADVTNCKRVKDFLEIDYFFSGHFTDKIKNKFHFMCTVTSGSPSAFWKNNIKRSPSIEELLLCMDVYPGDYIMPDGIPIEAQKKAIGNAVCVSLAEALAKCVTEKTLGLVSDGNGNWIKKV